MIEVKFLRNFTTIERSYLRGRKYRQEYSPGDTGIFDKEMAQQLIKDGMAVKVKNIKNPSMGLRTLKKEKK